MSVKIKIFIAIVIFSVLAFIFGAHNPLVAEMVKRKIKVGMSVDEVENILTRYKGRHFYFIKVFDEKTEKECKSIKPEYEECLKTSNYPDCGKKFGAYKDNCEAKRYKPEEFIEIVKDVASKKVDYVSYEAKIVVLFMGPVFFHNDFDIYFAPAGTVKSVTPVRHWD